MLSGAVFSWSQPDSAARWSDTLPPQTSKNESVVSLRVGQSRNSRAVIISSVFSALLALVLLVYFCTSPGSLLKSKAPVMRRLANSDEDEMCLDLLERMETINANGGKISSMPHALWHNQAIRKESGKRKREPSPDNQSEEVEQAKKPSLEEDRRNLSPVLPEDCVPSESSSWLAPPSQPPPESQHEYQGTGGTNSSPHTIDIDPTLNKDESAPWFTVIEDIFTGDEPVEQWFLDYILDPSSTLSPGGGLDQIHGSHEFPHKRAANAVDQLPPSGSPRPERQSSVAHGNAGGDAQLPVREGKDVQVYSDPSAVHPRPKSGLPKLQMHPLSLLVENFSGLHDTPSQVPRFIPPFDKCIIVYEPQPLPGGSLPSTSQVQTPAPMHGLISIDNESLGKHRFFRLPKADCSRKLIPFSMSRVTKCTPRVKLSQTLTSIQVLLTKEQLLPGDLQSLIMLAEQLVKHVNSMGFCINERVPTWKMREPIIRRFLVADALWSICAVVGAPMQKADWWKQVMDRILSFPKVETSRKYMANRCFRVFNWMVAALRMYRDGNRPAASWIIPLKWEIFCSPQAPSLFRSSEFDVFREGKC